MTVACAFMIIDHRAVANSVLTGTWIQFRPEPDHPASLINDFIDSLNIAKNYIFGRPQVYSSPATPHVSSRWAK